MRKKIQDLIRGTFEEDRPELIVPDKGILFEVLEEGVFRGEFTIKSSRKEAVRGLVLCSNPHILCLTPQFDAVSVTVKYEYHARELKEGYTDRGQFVIVSSSGEYTVPYEVSITRFYHQSSIGKIKTLNDFSNLAKLNWEEALAVFQSPQFTNIFPDENTELLYHGLCTAGMSSHEMEEFLIGIGKKARSFYEVDNPLRKLENVSSVQRDVITVTKSQWGFADIQISCQEKFIQLGKKRLQSYDFLGKHAKLDYTVHPEYMHAGKNFAKIELKTPFQTKTIQICASGLSAAERKNQSLKARRYQRYRLIQDYTEFSLDRLSGHQWKEESLGILREMIKENPENPWNYLFCCQVLILADQREDAQKPLEQAGKICKNMRTPAWGYWLYLKAVLGEGESDLLDVFEEIQEVFQKYKKHPVLFWVMLQINPVYEQSKERRYQALKRYLSAGMASPVFYLEAYNMLKDSPELVRGMDETEFRIFYWAARQQILTKELMNAVLAGASRVKAFHPRLFWLLGRCCRASQSQEAVKVICTYLIKNNRFGEAFFPWFLKGVESGLKIAGLYEAFIRSWHKKDGDIPEAVLKYFAVDTVLPAVLKGRLYAYLARNDRRLKQMLKLYGKMIYEFALLELKKGHMSDDLAEIYRYIKRQVTREEWERIGLGSGFVRKIVCPGYHFSKVAVYQSGNVYKQIVPLVGDTAYISVYSENSRILFEDSYGRRYFLKEGYRSSRMLPGEKMAREVVAVQEWKEENSQETLRDSLEQFADTIKTLDQMISEAEHFGMEVNGYREQLLVRMLFTEQFTENHAEYFRVVCSESDTAQIRDAYVSYFSWRYFVYKEEVPEEVFEYLEYSIQNQRLLNTCCEIAMMKYLCLSENLKETEYKLLDQMLEEYQDDSLCFPFYEQMDLRLKRKYFIHDCIWLGLKYERGRGINCRLVFQGRKEEASQILPVPEVFPGIYVLQVRLFARETLQYVFFETKEEVLQSGTRTLQQKDQSVTGTSRYDCLNQAIAGRGQDLEAIFKYARISDLSSSLFRPL